MTDPFYGVQPTGFVRKPRSVILAEIEREVASEFGPDTIQTPQSPMGQLNGLMADLVAELWERAEDLYQSYDPDQAEGVRLDTLARLRLRDRGFATDEELRRSITNAGTARVDLADLQQSLVGLDGVTYARVFVNETGEFDDVGLGRGTLAISVIGGDDNQIAEVIRAFVVPGINTFGNAYVTSVIDGFCRTAAIIRPIDVPVSLDVKVRFRNDALGCPPPSTSVVAQAVAVGWSVSRTNGVAVSEYTIRRPVETALPTVEVVSVTGSRDGETYAVGQPVPVSFLEIASVVTEDVTVTGVP